MDAVITAAGHALAHGDILGALKRVALREDPAALALRGIAMAQLGDLERARTLLKMAARKFGPKEIAARARCRLAEAEIALVSRDLNAPALKLAQVRTDLATHGDLANAAHATHLEARRLLLLGRADAAQALLDASSAPRAKPSLVAGRQLLIADIAARHMRIARARQTLADAADSAALSGIAALSAEIESFRQNLDAQSVRLTRDGTSALVSIDSVEAIFGSEALVVDACRNLLRQASVSVPLASRPVLFALLRSLATRWPTAVSRATLLAEGFGAKFTDESHRARLRVEIGRLRTLIGGLAEIESTSLGYRLLTPPGRDVVVLAPPDETRHAVLLALMADGEAWSSSALALVAGTSPRTVQRALEALSAAGHVQSFGKGPAQRWITRPLLGFPTILLLPGPLPGR
jgi:hypothetical protein